MKTNRIRQRDDNIFATQRGGWALLPVIRSRTAQHGTTTTELVSVQKPNDQRGNLGGVCCRAGFRSESRRARVPILRAGTTLTEVLMSLLIMSIGVMQVATLFPIAALRTLEANKQTNTTGSSP